MRREAGAGMRTNHRTLAVIVGLGGLLFGFEATVISGAIGFITLEFGLADWQMGLVVAASTLGAVAASISVTTLADRVGRKPMLMALAALYAVSAAGAALSGGFPALVAARIIGGYAFGSLSLAPIYVAEIAPPDRRGRLVAYNQLSIMVGFSAAYFANYLILRASSSHSPLALHLGLAEHAWRYMLGLQVVPALTWLALLTRVPESPRWLILRGREPEARAILANLLGRDAVERLIGDVRQREALTTVREQLRRLVLPQRRRILVVALVLAVAQQICGINAVYFYAPAIFVQSGVGTDAAFAQAVLVGITNLVFTVAAMLLIDRLGRRPLLLAGMAGITLSLATLAIGFTQAEYHLAPADAAELAERISQPALAELGGRTFASDVAFKAALATALPRPERKALEPELLGKAVRLNATLVLLAVLGFVASFAFSIGPVMWVMLAEIFSNAARGVGMAVAGSVNALVSFFVQLLFPIQLAQIGSAGVFALYALASAISALLIFRLVPETRGRSLEALESDLTAGRSVCHSPRKRIPLP